MNKWMKVILKRVSTNVPGLLFGNSLEGGYHILPLKSTNFILFLNLGLEISLDQLNHLVIFCFVLLI